MDKFLSIVVPYYKETEQEVFPLLSSINNQLGIDFNEIEIILVNDGTQNEFPSFFLQLFYNLEIRTILMSENRGPGVARQVGLDAASGDYIMFCDADDLLHSTAVLGTFIQALTSSRPDILTSLWLEEHWDEGSGRYIYVTHENEAAWMHGKAFRAGFLREKDLRFHPDLRVHEDSYFLALAFEETADACKLEYTSYVWKWTENSITRRNQSAYSYESFPAFHQAIGLSIGELERRAKGERLPFKIAQLLLYTYFVLHQDRWLDPDNLNHRLRAEASLIEALLPYSGYYREIPTEMIRQVYNEQRAENFANGIEVETYSDWVKRIGLEDLSAKHSK